MLSKMSITKNVLLTSSHSKKRERFGWFLTSKTDFESQISAPPHKNQFTKFMISYDYSWFLAKNFCNFVFFPWKLQNLYFHTWGRSLVWSAAIPQWIVRLSQQTCDPAGHMIQISWHPLSLYLIGHLNSI